METVQWKVDGMSCTNCALTIHKYLESEGLSNVKVNFMGGDVSFDLAENHTPQKIKTGIKQLGFHVRGEETDGNPAKKPFLSTHLQRFWFCLIFTLPLMLHMVGIHWLMNPWLQLALTLPVYTIGMRYFGRSAWKSLTKGIPNMNVLVALGATAAFVYSLIGTLLNLGNAYLFYETTATIITLISLGEWLEDKSVQTTQRSLKALMKTQRVMATMVAFDDQHQEQLFPVDSAHLHTGDIILIKTGEQVPADCKILWGEVKVNESILTGESEPLTKIINQPLIGGSVIDSGTVKAYVTAVGDNTVLSNIIRMVQKAQTEKPPVQQLADKISAIFVPAVVTLALIAFLGNWMLAQETVSTSLLRSIAVLVIACPCAMGLATPAAIAVGLGRAARNGVLFKDAKSLEHFNDIRQVVFDKTGTLTKGALHIESFKAIGIDPPTFQHIAWSLERYSNHPIAKCISGAWKTKNDIKWARIEEVKGQGIIATDKEGNSYTIGSHKTAAAFTIEEGHTAYIVKNNILLGWLDVADELRPESKSVISYLHSKGIKTILLSGDSEKNCRTLAQQLDIDEVYAEQSPEQKLQKIKNLTAQTPTAMVGDGVNDAPALAQATIGISMSDAAQIAVQSAQVILTNKGIKHLPLSLGLGKHTYRTIQQNLFWAFFYNIIAIPIAGVGLLTPTFAALAMGLSDVVLAINSIRLNYKKVL